jgi:hypothetical protein
MMLAHGFTDDRRRIDRPRIAPERGWARRSGEWAIPTPAGSRAHQWAASGLGGIDPFQCNPDRDRLSSVNFRG